LRPHLDRVEKQCAEETLYRNHDYGFGQAILTLRKKIGLTQIRLADFLGVSRRAIGDWEAGNSYPKPEHLEELIALAIEQHAFPAGREAEEIRNFWQAAGQKVLLDEAWLAERLLAGSKATQAIQEVEGTRLNWGDAQVAPTFYGREWELNLLEEWVINERCRVVTVLGMGGIGKSVLAVSLMRRVADRFEVVIWRSLSDIPTCEALLDDLLQVLASQVPMDGQASIEQRQSILLGQMRSARVLLVLDNLEAVLEEGEGAGRLRPGYEGIGRFLQLSTETVHQSCVLLASREKPLELISQEGSRTPVRTLRLTRLDVSACEELLKEKEVKGSAAERTRLIDIYTGNPLALKIVAQTIVDLFDGEIAPFLEQGEIIFGGVQELLNGQFIRLSALEQGVLLWLAILREPATLDDLLEGFVTSVPRARLLEAIEALYHRSLIERGQKKGSFTLQSVVLEYMTAWLIAEASSVIQQDNIVRSIERGLVLAQANEYVRRDRPYERLNITSIRGLTDTQKEALRALGAFEETRNGE
jgi:transcriptional regulator with XRE-family HTH domain